MTGFGLLGHAVEMAQGSDAGMEIEAKSILLFEEALDYAKKGMVPGGADANRNHFGPKVRKADSLDDAVVTCLWDPQTSGGLLITVAAGKADRLLALLKERGVDTARRIGRCIEAPARIEVV